MKGIKEPMTKKIRQILFTVLNSLDLSETITKCKREILVISIKTKR